jgi:signal transduction histidine kinase
MADNLAWTGKLAWTGPPPRLSKAIGEALLVVIVALAIDVRILASADTEQNAHAFTYVFGPVIAVGLLARKRWPLWALGYSLAVLLIYHATGNPGMSPVLALAVPVHYAAYAGRFWWAVGAAGLSVVTATAFSLVEHDGTVVGTLTERLLEAALLAVLVLLGETRRLRGTEADRSRREAERIARDKELDTDRRLAEQRLKIARDLHDVLAHTLAAASMQASVAADTLDDDPDTSRAAVEAIRQACRDARVELAAAVGLLRSDGVRALESPGDKLGDPVAGLEQLDQLIERAARAGLRIEVRTDGTPAPLPPAVDLTAYRVIQEALTNVARHSSAQTVQLRLTYRPVALSLSIQDEGPANQPPGRHPDDEQGGYGLLGMQERLAAIGGELTAGTASGGFLVTATLPLPADARSRS